MKNKDAISLAELAHLLGNGVTIENLRARIRRGSLTAFQDESGEWYVTQGEVKRLLEDVEHCHNCSEISTSYVIVKYHHHERVEFALCSECAVKAEAAYGRQGGVLEIVTYPFHGEGWLKP